MPTKEYYEHNKAHILSSNKAWKERNRERMRELGNAWKKAHPEYAAKMAEIWRERNPERALLIKRVARSVYKAIKSGKLTRPDRCQECGKECRPDAAHADYNNRFDVRWLCKSCHSKWDYREPKTR